MSELPPNCLSHWWENVYQEKSGILYGFPLSTVLPTWEKPLNASQNDQCIWSCYRAKGAGRLYNCYDYALNIPLCPCNSIPGSRRYIHQVGDKNPCEILADCKAMYPQDQNGNMTVQSVIDATKADGLTYLGMDLDTSKYPQKEFHVIALYVLPDPVMGNSDFHYIRRDADAKTKDGLVLWSSKFGVGGVPLQTDCNDTPLTDPANAVFKSIYTDDNRTYTFSGYFLVDNQKLKDTPFWPPLGNQSCYFPSSA